jgi:hypothetical protein
MLQGRMPHMHQDKVLQSMGKLTPMCMSITSTKGYQYTMHPTSHEAPLSMV